MGTGGVRGRSYRRRIERETKHDVIAFLTNLAEHIGENARFVHQGMTSSDVPGYYRLSVQLVQATNILLASLDRVLAALKKRAYEFKDTPTMERSHGIHAEPTTFGQKLAGHYAGVDRNHPPSAGPRGDSYLCNFRCRGNFCLTLTPPLGSMWPKNWG